MLMLSYELTIKKLQQKNKQLYYLLIKLNIFLLICNVFIIGVILYGTKYLKLKNTKKNCQLKAK